MNHKIIDLYDDFTHGGMNRREFFDRLARYAGSSAAAVALLPLLQNDYAQAAIVAADDARLATERLSFDAPKGKINGYLARPKSKGKRPVILVIHENRGLNPHLEDVARRFALEGFTAYAIDLLSLVGGTPASEDEAREPWARASRSQGGESSATPPAPSSLSTVLRWVGICMVSFVLVSTAARRGPRRCRDGNRCQSDFKDFAELC